MQIINNILGNHKEAKDLKSDFLKIAVVNNSDESSGPMVHGRAVGKEKKSFQQAVKK